MLTNKKRIAIAMFALLAGAYASASEAPAGVINRRNDNTNVASLQRGRAQFVN